MRGATATTAAEGVFHMHSISKIYHMGDVDVTCIELGRARSAGRRICRISRPLTS